MGVTIVRGAAQALCLTHLGLAPRLGQLVGDALRS